MTSTPPRDTAPIRTTLDTRLQLLAQQAVPTEPRPAVLVAISPSTGGILAAAQNAAANAQGPIAFSGAYPPGSTFKTITTAAAMQAGLATPDTPEACPGKVTIENRTIPNEDEFDLGTVPLSTAFSHSCNTTMAALADKLPADALPNMARLFGIGVDYVIPGLTTITGNVPNADTPAQKVESGIGQGAVTVSPFGLAVAEASLGHGSTIDPDPRRRRDHDRQHPLGTDSTSDRGQPTGDDAPNGFRRHCHCVEGHSRTRRQDGYRRIRRQHPFARLVRGHRRRHRLRDAGGRRRHVCASGRGVGRLPQTGVDSGLSKASESDPRAAVDSPASCASASSPWQQVGKL